MKDELHQIADLVHHESGIDVGRLGFKSLEAAIARVAPGIGLGDLLRTLGDAHAGASLRALLIEAVVVHETFFFRQRRDLEAIEWRTLLAQAHAAGADRVRVWVAACATGEEAYTIGILASEAFGSTAPPVSILATDISAAALLRAEHACYRGRALHAVEHHLIERYFQRDGDTLQVNDDVRALVQFRRHNLIHDPAPSAGGPFQLILCRNALIYFDPATVDRVMQLLHGALVDSGTLILSAADRLCSPTTPQPSPAGAPAPASWRRFPQPSRNGTALPAKNDWRSRIAAELAQPAPQAVPAEVEQRLSRALAAANGGNLAAAVAATATVLAEDPLNADAHFIQGIAQLRLGEAVAATGSLRRALYVEPGFALAAFKLGSAYDALGDEQAARRAYAQALRTLPTDDERHKRLAGAINAGDVAAACHARLLAPASQQLTGRR